MDQSPLFALFGGKPGEPVPQVDPEDVKAAWELGRNVQKRHPGQQVAIGWQIFERTCKPGADIRAVTYRASVLGLLRHAAPEVLEPWTKEDQLEAVIFRAAAQVPMEWMGFGIVRQGFPFDFEDFMRRVREA